MNNSRVSMVASALVLSAGLFNAVPSRADTVFDFSGVCDSGCTGTATGVLTLVDFFDDDNGMVDDATFISFEYSSSSGSFLITLADGGSANGLVYDDGRPFGGLFVSSSTGLPSFDATPDEFDVALDSATEDIGSPFNFLQVKGAIPEPSTWAMMLLGFAGFGYVGYRNAKQAAVASI